jgi:hypothetical protein
MEEYYLWQESYFTFANFVSRFCFAAGNNIEQLIAYLTVDGCSIIHVDDIYISCSGILMFYSISTNQ